MTQSARLGIRILLVDDHEIVRMGLRSVLAKSSNIEIVGEASTASAAVREAARLRPDVILMDVMLPDGNGFDACRQIQQQNVASRVVFLTSYADDEVIYKAITSGADGYLMKDCDGTSLARAIESVHDGKSILDPIVTRRVLVRFKTMSDPSTGGKSDQLSSQERRVVALVADGKTNKEIALELSLSDKTVKNYLSNAMGKLEMTRRSQAAAFYAQLKK